MRTSLPTKTHEQPRQRHGYFYFMLLCLVWLLGACGGTMNRPMPPVPTATPLAPAIVQITAEELPTLIVAEREASRAGNLPLLAAMWAEDARIVDGRGSATTDDDYIWANRAAILDRYEMAVFPAPPPALTLDEIANATVTVEGEQATLVNGSDRWRFILREGRWWLYELVYSAPSP